MHAPSAQKKEKMYNGGEGADSRRRRGTYMTRDLISLKAVNYIFDAHRGQKDKQGNPYEEHLWGVAKLAPAHLMIPALAQNLLEDTHATEDAMRLHEFSEREIELVNLLTLSKGQRRDDYLKAIRKDPDAVCIKIADVVYNVSRIHGIEDENERLRLTQKYVRTLEVLVNGY